MLTVLDCQSELVVTAIVIVVEGGLMQMMTMTMVMAMLIVRVTFVAVKVLGTALETWTLSY